jgi:hypothetical protein
MRILRRETATLTCALATALFSARAGAQQLDPYHQTLYFGTGLVNIPVAWVSPTSYDVFVNISGKRLPSFSDPGKQSFASLWNTNVALDVHLWGRLSAGAVAYSQNPDYGFFAQGLLWPDQVGSYLPGVAIGARNIGGGEHQDRFFIAHDIAFTGTGYEKGFDPNYENFSTSPSFYGVVSKQFALGTMMGRLPGSQMGVTVGWGNGIFSDDGELGEFYNRRGTIAEGLFLGTRFTMHPSLNSTLDIMVENDGWDYNAGLVYDWRGLSAGLYATEIEEGGRGVGGKVYNYTKFNASIGYSGNIIGISRGVLLRSRITELTREQYRLTAEIEQRGRRIRGLEVALRRAQAGELAGMAQRRADLERTIQEEREAIRRAEERLRGIQQGQPNPPSTPPSGTPPSITNPPLN